MHLLPLLSVAILPVASLARMHIHRSPESHSSRHHNFNRATTYKLQDKHQGQTFFDGWNFFADADPTHGNVIYQSKENAKDLAYVQSDGTAVMKVDNVTQVAPGGNRRSVRITSKAAYNGALVIGDFWAFAHGPTVWPAFWAVGPAWPNTGEIDIFEFVNDYTSNQYTLHTGSNAVCKANPNVGPKFKSANSTMNKSFLGTSVTTECQSSGANNAGCAFTDVPGSAGHAFNAAGGGVYAMLWNNDTIAVWRFERASIPQDIQSGNPNPDSWGTPVALWTNDSCDISRSFRDLSLVLNISICGDWAGSVFVPAGTCGTAVGNSTNYDYAHIMVNYIAVYQPA